jgi:hypothetical protein
MAADKETLWTFRARLDSMRTDRVGHVSGWHSVHLFHFTGFDASEEDQRMREMNKIHGALGLGYTLGGGCGFGVR